MLMGWLLRAFITTTMLLMTTACVLRFTHSQNYVSFPVFAKLFAQTSICELIDLSMKGLTILPFIFTKGKTNSTFLQRILFCGMSLKKRSSYFFIYPTKQLFLWGTRKHHRLWLYCNNESFCFTKQTILEIPRQARDDISNNHSKSRNERMWGIKNQTEKTQSEKWSINSMTCYKQLLIQ